LNVGVKKLKLDTLRADGYSGLQLTMQTATGQLGCESLARIVRTSERLTVLRVVVSVA
jgi:hypothetical protein